MRNIICRVRGHVWYEKNSETDCCYRRCPMCGQKDEGQTGEYPCHECGLPTTWDAAFAAASEMCSTCGGRGEVAAVSGQPGEGPMPCPDCEEGNFTCAACGAVIAWRGEKLDDCLRCGAALAASGAEEKPRVGATTFQWLIERGQPEGLDRAVWLENSAQHPARDKQWTTNANEAAMFPSRETAEAYIAECGLTARAVEHGFMAAASGAEEDTRG